jgi:hypothetical protein
MQNHEPLLSRREFQREPPFTVQMPGLVRWSQRPNSLAAKFMVSTTARR